MKRLHLPLLVALAFSAASGGAWAQSAQFDMTGQITLGTCDWAVGDDNRTIRLDPINANALPANGGAGFKAFRLTLHNCTPVLSNATFIFSGTPDTVDALRFQSTGDATGVAVELASMDGQTIGADGTNNTRTTPIVSGQSSLLLQAGYWRLGGQALNAGTVTAVSTVTLNYN
ncbi:fimbrial protein [Dyella koreensis]|uniref:Type 1 fimbrial protein n=1 Tax=Dyella koreensis TaxID=311235 RepID=A0ABW8K7N5_9GAMM